MTAPTCSCIASHCWLAQLAVILWCGSACSWVPHDVLLYVGSIVRSESWPVISGFNVIGAIRAWLAQLQCLRLTLSSCIVHPLLCIACCHWQCVLVNELLSIFVVGLSVVIGCVCGVCACVCGEGGRLLHLHCGGIRDVACRNWNGACTCCMPQWLRSTRHGTKFWCDANGKKTHSPFSGVVTVDLNRNDDWEPCGVVSLLLLVWIGAIFAGTKLSIHFWCILVQGLSTLLSAH